MLFSFMYIQISLDNDQSMMKKKSCRRGIYGTKNKEVFYVTLFFIDSFCDYQ
jgi:hypothetical protein